MSFTNDTSPWPAPNSDDSSSRHYFPSTSTSQETLPSSTYSPHASIQINTASALPHYPPGSGTTPPPRSRVNTAPSSTRRTTSVSMSAIGGPPPLPLTNSSRVIKTKRVPVAPKPEEVWREALKTAYGRDKAFVSCVPLLLQPCGG